MKKKKDYEFYLTRFQEVVCFLTAVGIKKHFKTVAEYKKAPNSSKAYCLNISGKILVKLSRVRSIDKYRFEEFIEASSSLFTYHKHCHKTYKSGKKFSRNSWFELSDLELEKWFSNDSNFNTKTCELINKESHKWIDKHIYYKLQQKEDNMTKAEKEAVYKKYADGKGAFTSPEFEIKQIEKKERSQKRRQETIAKKAVQASFVEFAELRAENEQLKAEIAKLKQLKDLNSDIPEDTVPEAELEENQSDKIAESIMPDFVKDGSDIPEAEPIQITDNKFDNSDIPEEEPPHPSKVLPRLAEFVKKCYIGPSAASKISELYGEKQIFKQPNVECDMISALQKNAKQRLVILSTTFKELSDKLLKKDLMWLASNINKAQNELRTI